jgi:hypothetical protein
MRAETSQDAAGSFRDFGGFAKASTSQPTNQSQRV